MTITLLALNFGLITNVLASDLDESDQTFSLPIKEKPGTASESSQTNHNSGTSAPLPTGYWVATAESCNIMNNKLMMVQNVDHSIFDAKDLNGDGTVNLTDTVILSELDLGGPGGQPDQVINLTDVVLFAQRCNGLITQEPALMALTTAGPAYHGTWCSALLGIDSSETLHNNTVIDANDDGVVNLTDDVLIADWYNSGDNNACYSRFATGTADAVVYNFNSSTYTNIDWCAGLVQGIKDIYANALNPSNYDPIFDLNDDEVINLTDTVMATQYLGTNDQATCYKHYGFTDWTTQTNTQPDTEENNPPFIGGNGPLNYTPNSNPLIPQVLGEKIVECKNKVNTTLTKFTNGTLVRGCGPKIYVIKDGKKIYIPNLETLRSKYFGKKILNIGDLINDIKDWSAKLAIK